MRQIHTTYATLLLGLIVSTTALAQVPPIVGDLNDDGFVGITDMNVVLGHWNQTVTPGDWSQGDPSGDGFVGIEDLNAVLGNWNAGYLPRQAFKGMNLDKFNYSTREWVFVDIVKTLNRWVPTDTNGWSFETGGPIGSDPNGWPILVPGRGAHALFFSGNAGHHPTDTYDVTFDVEVSNDDPNDLLVWNDLVVKSRFDATNNTKVTTTSWVDDPVVPNKKTASGHWTFDVNTTSNNGILSLFANKHPAATVKFHNVKVTMPGYKDAVSPFHPLFIKRLRPFSVIRFMDWQKTNDVENVAWNTRATKDYFSQATSKGVAVEYLIELCNELQADPWFCMPHLADDAYVTSFAELVRDGDPANNIAPLHSNAKIYVEWSNEVWNAPLGKVYDWIKTSFDPPEELGSDEFYGKWAAEAAKDFKVWHDESTHSLVRVLAGQAGNVDVARQVANRLKNLTFAEQFDAISCAAYFGGGNNSAFGSTTTAQDVIDHAVGTSIPQAEGWYRQHGDIGDGEVIPKSGLAWEMSDYLNRSIPFLAYEAGQHYASNGNDEDYSQAFYAAQHHVGVAPAPGIYEAYTQNLAAYRDAGGSLFMAYTYVGKQDSKYGSWGHLESQDESIEEAHKFRAILNFRD